MSVFTKIDALHASTLAELSLGIYRGISGAAAPCFIVAPHRGLLENPDVLAALQNDLQLTLELRHTNIITACAKSPAGAAFAVAYEFAEGLTLEELLEFSLTTKLKLSLPMALHLGLELARAAREICTIRLSEARGGSSCEGAGMLMPGLAHISIGGDVKLFGTFFGPAIPAIGRAFPDLVFNATRRYVAPEVLAGGKITGAADVYSLGVIIWETLAHRRFNATPIATHSNEIPAGIAALIDGATAREPAKRSTTVESLETELGSYLRGTYSRFTARHLGIYVKGLTSKKARNVRQKIADAVANANTLLPRADGSAERGTNTPAPPKDYVLKGRDLDLSEVEADQSPKLVKPPPSRPSGPLRLDTRAPAPIASPTHARPPKRWLILFLTAAAAAAAFLAMRYGLSLDLSALLK